MSSFQSSANSAFPRIGNNIPPEIRLVSAAPSFPLQGHIPINLLLLIIQQLDDIETLANVTRTSRLLYYLTIPRLYEVVTLKAYSAIRYINDRPEGFGGGSPFAMGLDGLISSPNNVAQYVKTLRMCGDWREVDTGDFERGRVPDNTMILNVTIKAAISRADRLESFIWEMNTKPMKTIYQGLATRKHLTHLKIHFPSSRIPRPTVTIPGLPRLKSLHVVNIDPLCYNDDISLLLLEAQKLETLTLHWSPRMRNEREPSVDLQSYFGRIVAEKKPLSPKHISFFNMFAKNDGTLTKSVLFTEARSLCFMNSMNHNDPTTVFWDHTWNPRGQRIDFLSNVVKIRSDSIDTSMVNVLKALQDLQEVYLVNNRDFSCNSSNSLTTQKLLEPGVSPSSVSSGTPTPYRTNGNEGASVTIADLGQDISTGAGAAHNETLNPPTIDAPQPSPVSSEFINSPLGSSRTGSAQKHISLASDYIAAITSHHGQSLRILLLRDTWTLGRDVVLHIAKSCPNLEQLAYAPESPGSELTRTIIKACPKLYAVRLLYTPDHPFWLTMRHEPQTHVEMMGLELWRDEYLGMKYLGVGGFIAKLGGRIRATEGPKWRRSVKLVTWEEARHVEIFGLDNIEIS
ncbi:hypothetical protein BT63DRAFT_478328 [Microthyrium microscopicum]|uniref:Uncharacterized protein n=1 Tax=Microthyrium microscopicum TaxID=703497 RepID=A0A6A6UF75_9PEZI|nr:hypothetical protein BT63DRAFT_478328 [Microthyrium microscopicum]